MTFNSCDYSVVVISNIQLNHPKATKCQAYVVAYTRLGRKFASFASCAQIVQDKIGQRRLTSLKINKFTLCIALLIEFSLYFHLKTL